MPLGLMPRMSYEEKRSCWRRRERPLLQRRAGGGPRPEGEMFASRGLEDGRGARCRRRITVDFLMENSILRRGELGQEDDITSLRCNAPIPS